MGRTCNVSGLRLIPARGIVGYRIARTVYPALSAAQRNHADDREDWGRYDVPGETLYLAGSREAAFGEVLAPFKRRNGAGDPLAKDAAALGMTLEEFVEEVARDWSDRDFMGLGAVPAGWRYDREIRSFELSGPRWLIDVEHADSIAVIERRMEQELADAKIGHLTTSHLRADEREVTTSIAERLQAVVLEDGSQAMGIHFGTKHGGDWCAAIWLGPTSATEVTPSPADAILVTDADMTRVADRFQLRVF